MTQLIELNSWKALGKQAQSIRLLTNKEVADRSPHSNTAYLASTPEIQLNYANQRIDQLTLELLFELANERHLKNSMDALFSGDIVNRSEGKPALHSALRTFNYKPVLVDSHDIIPDILATREKIKEISTQIRALNWLGYTGKPITNIVNIGIGGSDLGPRFCVSALANYTSNALSYHFISDADPSVFCKTVASLNKETTLFIVSSKSFTTRETVYNAKKALDWLGDAHYFDRHVIAITANTPKAQAMGINNILPIWDWIGGRYSPCSAINLITAIAIGFDNFTELLAGANSMDKHFQQSRLEENIPVLLALLGIWNNNFLHIHNVLTLVYAQQLEQFVPYIQQLEMESNGKSIDNSGRAINYATGPIIWGGLGNQAQHSYYQLLCQGTHRTTVDLMSVKVNDKEVINEICLAHQQVLTQGVAAPANGYIPGNMPLNHISLTDCSPRTIGALIALYEHKVFTQACIWNINPFDQPGVESAKRGNSVVNPLAWELA